MHELSIVASLIELCEENAGDFKISEIYTKMGVLSGIDRSQFERCFEAFKSGTKCENATLFIENEALRGICECGFEGEIFDLNAKNLHFVDKNLDIKSENLALNSNKNLGISSENSALNFGENLALKNENFSLNNTNLNDFSSLNFHCPKCGSNSLKITAGEDFYLMRLVME